MPDIRLAFRAFAEQLAFFRRKINVPTARWDDLRLGDHAHGFMVAGLARQDVLDDMRDAITRAIRDGETLEDFRSRFNDIVRGRWEGFTGDGSARGLAWRTRIIYQTNLRTSYMAGRWETLRKFPFLRYNHHTLLNPREQHLAWDDLIIAANDPWWAIHYPPNGWGCRCDATGVSDQRLRALGRKADGAPAPITGDPPPEWSYHVGEAARSLPVAAAFGERVMQLPPAWRDQALADAQTRQVDWFGDWPGVVRGLLSALDAGTPAAIGVATPVGMLSARTVDRFASLGMARRSIATATIAVDDRALASALIAPTAGVQARVADGFTNLADDLPAWLGSPDAVLFDDFRDVIIYARRQDSDYITVTIKAGLSQRSARGTVLANWITEFRFASLDDLSRLELIEGSL